MEQDQQLGHETLEKDTPPQTKEIPIGDLDNRNFGDKVEKQHLGGQRVTIFDVKLLPTGKLSQTKDKTKEYEPVTLRLFYNDNKIWENLNGVRMFKRSDGTFGEPNLWPKGTNAASRVFKKWLAFKNKTAELKVEDVSFKDFLTDLKGKTVSIVEETVNNPTTGVPTFKNMVEEFLSIEITEKAN